MYRLNHLTFDCFLFSFLRGFTQFISNHAARDTRHRLREACSPTVASIRQINDRFSNPFSMIRQRELLQTNGFACWRSLCRFAPSFYCWLCEIRWVMKAMKLMFSTEPQPVVYYRYPTIRVRSHWHEYFGQFIIDCLLHLGGGVVCCKHLTAFAVRINPNVSRDPTCWCVFVSLWPEILMARSSWRNVIAEAKQHAVAANSPKGFFCSRARNVTWCSHAPPYSGGAGFPDAELRPFFNTVSSWKSFALTIAPPQRWLGVYLFHQQILFIILSEDSYLWHIIVHGEALLLFLFDSASPSGFILTLQTAGLRIGISCEMLSPYRHSDVALCSIWVTFFRSGCTFLPFLINCLI